MPRPAEPASAAARRPTPPMSRRRWRTPLLMGLCFGLGYGVTHRLLALQWPGFVKLGQNFDLRPFPGTSLESLRQKAGAAGQSIRADLDLIERRAENRRAEDQARRLAEQEQRRLEAIEQPQEADPPAEPDLRVERPESAPAAPAAPAPPLLPPPAPASP